MNVIDYKETSSVNCTCYTFNLSLLLNIVYVYAIFEIYEWNSSTKKGQAWWI